MCKPSTYLLTYLLVTYFPTYLPIYETYFPTELVTKVKPKINSHNHTHTHNVQSFEQKWSVSGPDSKMSRPEECCVSCVHGPYLWVEEESPH